MNDSDSGKYLIRLADSTPGLELNTNSSSEHQGYVSFPTTYGLIFFRLLLRNNGSDIAVGNGIRSQLSLSPVNRTKREPIAPALTRAVLNTSLDPAAAALTFPGGFNISAAIQLLNLTARLYPFNLAENRTDVPRVTNILTTAGLTNGSYTQPSPDLNYTLGGLLVNATISKTLQSPSRLRQLRQRLARPPAIRKWRFPLRLHQPRLHRLVRLSRAADIRSALPIICSA